MQNYNSYRQQRMREMGGVLSDRDLQAMNNNLPNDYRNYTRQQIGGVLSQNGGVLSAQDLQAINKMINPQYQMPTYTDIYNNVLSRLGWQ